MDPRSLSIADYTYELPIEKIASKPSRERGNSRLLIWKAGEMKEDIYKNISDHLPVDSIMFFNDTRVIPARLLFKKSTGSVIEIFCLEALQIKGDHSMGLKAKGQCKWKCFVGGISKWKEDQLEKIISIDDESLILNARVVEQQDDAYIILFTWEGEQTFEQIINAAGDVPLPPYIKRKTEQEDKSRYQTVFAKHQGSVAAPTAALHFTQSIIESIRQKNIVIDYVTLHVGAGTFKPVKSARMHGHEMHSEWIDVSFDSLKNILDHCQKTIVSVGTTSARTLESLYWMGVKILIDKEIEEEQLPIKQWEVYEFIKTEKKYTRTEVIGALLEWIKKNKLAGIFVTTQILIAPGYEFKMVDILVTNFHQPQSTLLLLVAAAIGDAWRDLYDHALNNGFYFLSYGDGCLLHVGKNDHLRMVTGVPTGM